MGRAPALRWTLTRASGPPQALSVLIDCGVVPCARMLWFLFAVLAPALWALSNVVDGELVRGREYDAVTLSALAALFAGAPALAMLVLQRVPPPPSPTALALVGAAVAAGTLVYLPYFSALRYGPTAMVSTLWNLSPAFVALAGRSLLHENLGFIRYVGMAFLIVSATIATVPDGQARRVPIRMLTYMGLASLLLASETLALDAAYASLPFPTALFYISLGSLLVGGTVLGLHRSARSSLLSTSRRDWLTLTANQGLDTVAGISAAGAISLGSASLVKAVGSTQPLFVVLIAMLVRPWLSLEGTLGRTPHQRARMTIAGIVALAGCVLVGWQG